MKKCDKSEDGALQNQSQITTFFIKKLDAERTRIDGLRNIFIIHNFRDISRDINLSPNPCSNPQQRLTELVLKTSFGRLGDIWEKRHEIYVYSHF